MKVIYNSLKHLSECGTKVSESLQWLGMLIKSGNDTKYFINSPPSSSSHGVLIEKLSVAIILN